MHKEKDCLSPSKLMNSHCPQAIRLDGRLKSAAQLIRPGVYIADIGTDHAYLPIYLLQNDRISGAVATDIRQGPLKTASDHIAKYRLSDRITVFQTDGLHGVEQFKPSDISICGMGGESITEILQKSPYIRSSGIHLILQPMTMPAYLRKWLSAQGFHILDETLAQTKGKIYPVLLAEYDGEIRSYSNAEYLLGPCIIKKRKTEALKNIFPALLTNQTNTLKKIICGKKKSGEQPCDELLLLEDLLLLQKEGN